MGFLAGMVRSTGFLCGNMDCILKLFNVLIGCRVTISFPFLSCSMTTSANTGGGCEVDVIESLDLSMI